MTRETLAVCDAAGSWPPLTVHDRCDGCGVPATARAVLPTTSERPGDGVLLFCGHHLREHGPRVIAAGGLLVVLPGESDPARFVAQRSPSEQPLER